MVLMLSDSYPLPDNNPRLMRGMISLSQLFPDAIGISNKRNRYSIIFYLIYKNISSQLVRTAASADYDGNHETNP